MDRELPNDIKVRRNRKLALLITGPLVLLLISAWWLRSTIKPSVKRATIILAAVERGDVENTIGASGTVMPEFEEVITSPIEASIHQILVNTGSEIKAGRSVLNLDKSATITQYEKLKFQLESKRNIIRKLKLDLDQTFFDLKSNNDIKQLKINNLKASAENEKRLFKAGGCTREDVEQAELNLQTALLEKAQLENQIVTKQQSMRLDLKQAEIDADIQQNDLKDLERKLHLAEIVASRAGVVTWVNKNIGAAVKEGDPLARIADLGSFKITGTVSDNFSGDLHPGINVIVRINETKIKGKITNIHPTIQNETLTFDIEVDDKSNPLLRPDLKVDVFVVTAIHKNVLRVANGAAFKGSAVQDIFVLNKSKALRRTVHIGMTNFDYVEITDNISQGEQVITSDMSTFRNAREINIEN